MTDTALNSVLLVDDEAPLATALGQALQAARYRVQVCTSPQAALIALGAERYDLLLTDLMMPGMDGTTLLQAAHDIDPSLVGIIMTGQGTVETAVKAMKTGAYDYVLKPFKLATLLPVLVRALELRRLRGENLQLRETVALHTLSATVATTLDRQQILTATLAAVRQQNDADEVSILLLTPDGAELRVAAVEGVGREELLGHRLAVGQDIAGWVAQHRESLLLNGPVADPRFQPRWPRPEIRSAISMPMLAGGTLIGVMNINSLRRHWPITPGQLKALTLMANTAAAALQNANLFAAVDANERRFRALVQNSSDGITLHSADGRVLYASPSVERMGGYASDELQANEPMVLVHPDDRPIADQLMLSLMQTPGQPHQAELRSRGRDGTWRWLAVTAVNLLEQPEVAAIVSNYRDITEAREADRQIRFQAYLLDRIGQAVIGTNLEGRITYWNHHAETLYGWSKAEVLGLDIATVTPAQTSWAQAQEILKQLRAGESWQGEFEVQRRDGLVFPVLVTDSPVHDEAGQLIGIVGVSADITERRRSDLALRQSEERFSHAFRASPAALRITEMGAEARFVDVNRAFTRMLGYERDEIVGHIAEGFGLWLQPSERQRVLTHLERHGALYDVEVTFRTKVGQLRDTLTSFEVIELNGRRCILTSSFDITSRKQHERELESMAAMSRALHHADTWVQMLTLFLDQAIQLLDAETGAFVRHTAAANENRFELGRGVWSQASALTNRLEADWELRLTANSPPAISPSPDWPAVGSADASPRAMISLPLNAFEQLVGFLWVGREKPFTEGDARVLSAVAGVGANALQRAALHEQLERQLAYESALREIDVAISASLDLRVTLDLLIGQVVTHLVVDAAAILLINPLTHQLEYASQRDITGNLSARKTRSMAPVLAKQVMADRRLISLPGAGEAPIDVAWLDGLGFQTYCGVPLVTKGVVAGVLEVFNRSASTPSPEWIEFLEALARQAAIAIDNARLFERLQNTLLELRLSYDATIEGWSRALDLRDKETEGHSQRVTELALLLGRAFGLTGQALVQLRRGALLHDVGKLGIPDAILLKPGPLTDTEWAIMKQHPTYAYEMLSPITYLLPALDIPYAHHEKWDGTGYPRGLRGAEIPLAARVFAIVDVWDALRSKRPYRPAWTEAQVREHIRQRAGTHFDPQVVEVFERLTANGALAGPVC